MKEHKIKNILIQTATAAAGSLGIVSVLFARPAVNVYPVLIYIAVIISACVIVPCISIKKISRWFNAIFCAVSVIFVAVASKTVISGVKYIVEDLTELLLYGREFVRSGSDASSYSLARINRGNAETAAMIVFSILVVYMVSLIVVYTKSMVLSIISILPLMSLFVFYSVIPSSLTCVLCLVYVFAVASLDRRREDTAPAAAVLAAGFIVGGILIFAGTLRTDYNRPQIFVEWGEQAGAFFDNAMNIDNSGGLWANGGTGDSDGSSSHGTVTLGITNEGEIGEADVVEWDDKPVGIISTEYTGKSQYIGIFYSNYYYYGENVWEESQGVSETDSAKLDVLAEIFADEQMRDYISGGSGDFEDMVRIYYVSRNSGDIDIGTGRYIEDIDESCIGRIAEIVNGHAPVETQLNSRLVRSMENARRNAESFCLDIDSGLKATINELIGDIPATTLQQKLYYIDYVRSYLANNFVYTTAPGHVPEGRDAIDYFLTESRQGYCTYFASAAVMMFRAAGIPARYVEGYVVPSYRVSGGAETSVLNRWAEKCGLEDAPAMIEGRNTQVRNSDAHAWVEVYLTGYGWRTVEVTPSVNAGRPEGDGISENESISPDEEETISSDNVTDDESDTAEDMADGESQVEDENISSETVDEADSSGITGVVWKIIVIALAAVLVVIFIISRIIKRKKLEFTLDSSDIIGIYSALEKLLDYAGYVRPGYMDYEEYAEYLESRDWIFKMYNIRMMTDTVLAVNFGGDSVSVADEQRKSFEESAAGLRQCIYMRMNPIKRLFVKYILVI